MRTRWDGMVPYHTIFGTVHPTPIVTGKGFIWINQRTLHHHLSKTSNRFIREASHLLTDVNNHQPRHRKIARIPIQPIRLNLGHVSIVSEGQLHRSMVDPLWRIVAQQPQDSPMLRFSCGLTKILILLDWQKRTSLSFQERLRSTSFEKKLHSIICLAKLTKINYEWNARWSNRIGIVIPWKCALVVLYIATQWFKTSSGCWFVEWKSPSPVGCRSACYSIHFLGAKCVTRLFRITIPHVKIGRRAANALQ